MFHSLRKCSKTANRPGKLQKQPIDPKKFIKSFKVLTWMNPSIFLLKIVQKSFKTMFFSLKHLNFHEIALFSFDYRHFCAFYNDDISI